MKSDLQLKQDVMNELNWDPAVNDAEIGVQVEDGVVTLSGHLDSFAEKHAAQEAVQRIVGVRALAVEIDVRLPDECRRTDADIGRAVANVFTWNTLIPSDHIKIEVEHGEVTLTGQVDWHYQRVAAERVVVGLLGVTGVKNALVLRPQADKQDLTQRIKEAIERQAVDDAAQVTVTVKNGTVTLGGSLRTWVERESAFNAAWAAPGVENVVNNIMINL